MKVDTSKYNHTCYIVGGGPSLKDFDWSRLGADKFVIAINTAYKVLPNAQVVYFTDTPFWRDNKEQLLLHKGQLLRGALKPQREEQHERITYYTLTGPHGLETAPMSLKHGHNSTYAAINLAAVHFGFKQIFLFGIDMKWGEKGNRSTSHWHQDHKRVDAESVYSKMMRAYDTIAPELANIGVKVFNTNPDSALEVFPKVTQERALAGSI